MSKSISASINSMSFRGKLVICSIAFFLIGLGISWVLLVNLPLSQTPETVNQVYGRVQYNGEWRCAYGDAANPTLLDGAGESIINLTKSLGTSGNIYIIFLNVQKLDNSTEPLIIMITTEDGTVVAQASTDEPYGWARVGYDFQENTEPTLEIEELIFDNVSWDSNLTYADITVRNVGTAALTIVNLYMNDMSANNITYTSGSANIQAGDTATLRVAGSFTSGTKYSFCICTASGDRHPYDACAP